MRHLPPPRRRTVIHSLRALAAASAALLAAAVAVPALADPSASAPPSSTSASASASASASPSASNSAGARHRASASPAPTAQTEFRVRAWFEPSFADVDHPTTLVVTADHLTTRQPAEVVPVTPSELITGGCTASPAPRNSCKQTDPDGSGNTVTSCELQRPGGTCRFSVQVAPSDTPPGRQTEEVRVSVGDWHTTVDAIGVPSASPSASSSTPVPSHSPSQPGPTGQGSQPGSSGGLPVTGTSLPLVGGLAAVLLGTGAALLILARRRRNTAR